MLSKTLHVVGVLILCGCVYSAYSIVERGYTAKVDELSGRIVEGERINRGLQESNKFLTDQNKRATILVDSLRADNTALRDENQRAGVLVSKLRGDNTALRNENRRAGILVDSIQTAAAGISAELTGTGDTIQGVIEGIGTIALLIKAIPD